MVWVGLAFNGKCKVVVLPADESFGGMVKRLYKIVYTNMLNIFNRVEYIQTYSLYSKKVSLRIIQIFSYSIIQYS